MVASRDVPPGGGGAGTTTLEQCQRAFDELAERLSALDPALRRRHILDRTVACTLSDLGATFVGRIDAQGLHDISLGSASEASIRLRMTSDDLLSLTRGHLNLATAWARGRVKIEASMLDLLRMRSLL